MLSLESYFFIIIILFLSISIGYFQYFFKSKSRSKVTFFLFGLRTISLFLLGLILINPTIKTTEVQSIKPVLPVLIDNSASTAYFKEEANVNQIISTLKNHTALQAKFDLSYFSFGDQFQVLDSLSFAENQSNIHQAISATNQLYKKENAPIILISDGNQTLGNDYTFSTVTNPIYPLVIGDTTKYKDLAIQQLNVNKYSYIKNRFPVEALLSYEGKGSESSTFSILKNGRRVFSKKVFFSKSKKTITISTSLPSLQTGKNYYTAILENSSGEKNIVNNQKAFSVEVIDEQTKVVILTSMLHPDIGALKRAIETNKQRKVTIKKITDGAINLDAYQLVVLYQPSQKFSAVINKVVEKKLNYFIITGTKTDWSFLNTLPLGVTKQAINRSENYLADYNKNFLVFSQDDIGFQQFPPLEDLFGETTFSKPYEPLLFQNINGISFNYPLLATLDDQGQKSAILLGEGLWKWRATSYRSQNSFEDFDNFIATMTQYLASTKIRKRLEVNVDAIFPANASVQVTTFYVDNNYKFDDRAAIDMKLTNADKSIQKTLPFSVIGNSYQLNIENLPPGEYGYTVKVQGQSISTSGTFKITPFKVEEQFVSANDTKLKALALKTGGKAYANNQTSLLINDLLQNKKYYTTQKELAKEYQIIDWKWALILSLFLLTVEWLTRKYYGKI